MPDHRLYGTELPVHGWHHVQGQIHVLVTLPDGSRGYLPVAGTALYGEQDDAPSSPALTLTTDAVRQLRLHVEALQKRRRGRRSGPLQSK